MTTRRILIGRVALDHSSNGSPIWIYIDKVLMIAMPRTGAQATSDTHLFPGRRGMCATTIEAG